MEREAERKKKRERHQILQVKSVESNVDHVPTYYCYDGLS